ncbi:hypothetical protein D3C78_1767940 [compost metagenome]
MLNADLDFPAFDTDSLAVGTGKCLGQACFYQTESDGVDVDFQATPFFGKGLGQTKNAGLGG